jgi:phosphoribosylglycinamide formyltransferase-1
MDSIVVLFSGEGSNLEYLARVMHKKELEIVATITNKPEAGGISISNRYGIPCHIIDSKGFETREAFDAKLVEQISIYNPDLVVLAGFMRILTPIFTSSIKAINLHPSLLPRHKGLHAIEKSYDDEYPEGGVTVHYVSSELDGGDIILQREIPKAKLSKEEYKQRVLSVEKEVLADAINMVLS